MLKLKKVPIDVIAYFSILFLFFLVLNFIYGFIFGYLTVFDGILAAGALFAIGVMWANAR